MERQGLTSIRRHWFLQVPQSNDLTNKKFGMLKVLSFAGLLGGGGRNYDFWYCQCECGRMLFVMGKHLSEHIVQDCGCTKREKRLVL